MTPTNLLQIGNDIDRSVYEQILQFIRLRVTETYAFPPEIVRVDDITIATLGNFSASVGKPKSKRPSTSQLSWLRPYRARMCCATMLICRRASIRYSM